MQNLEEPLAPARAVLGKLAFASDMALPLERPSNQDDAANCLAALLCRTTTLTSASQCADLVLVRSMTPYRVAIVFLPALLFGCASTTRARFGVINGIDIVETHHIPYTVGAHYGFRVDYHDIGRPVTLREEF